MNDVSLITVDDIKELTSISKNINPEVLEPYILIGEEFFVNPILGDALLSELKNQITGNTISSSNATLLNIYIRPLAAYGAWHEASPFLNFKTVGKGIMKQSSTYSDNVDLNEFTFFRKALKDKVTFFENRLKAYLDNNTTLYPLYRANCNDITENGTGIYLGRSLD